MGDEMVMPTPEETALARRWISEMTRIRVNLQYALDLFDGGYTTYMACHRTAALIAAAGARFEMEMDDDT